MSRRRCSREARDDRLRQRRIKIQRRSGKGTVTYPGTWGGDSRIFSFRTVVMSQKARNPMRVGSLEGDKPSSMRTKPWSGSCLSVWVRTGNHKAGDPMKVGTLQRAGEPWREKGPWELRAGSRSKPPDSVANFRVEKNPGDRGPRLGWP